MTTNNNPAHGPVSLERLHQIREILSKAAAQSDGGNLGYAMADAVKVIEVAIASFGDEPVAWMWDVYGGGHMYAKAKPQHIDSIPLYTVQPAMVSVPDESAIFESAIDICRKSDAIDEHAWNRGVLAVMSAFRACRAAMLQAGNSQVTPDGWTPVSERMPLTTHENCLYEDVEVQVFAGDDVFIAHYAIGALPEPWGAWLDTAANITHWQPLAAPPQQEDL